MKKALIVLFTVLGLSIYAKDKVSFINMSEELQVTDLSDSLKDHGAVYLSLDVSLDFRYDESGLIVYTTEHKRVLITDEEAISSFNTYYVGDDVIEWVKLEARTIGVDGEIVKFDKSSVKEIVDEETGDNYKAFAIDGIKEGDVVEYLTIKKHQSSTIGQLILQKKYPIVEASYTISCPFNLEYVMKSYNALGSKYSSEVVDSIRYYNTQISDLPPYKSESFSYTKPNKARVEYRLDKNSVKGKYQVNSWDKAASNIYGSIYDISAKESKSIKSLIEDLELSSAQINDVEKLESYLKKEVLVKDNVGAEYHKIDFLLDEKIASKRGMTKVFANVLKELGIEHSVVLTCSRIDYKFDKDFQNWNRLDEYLIFLPQFEKYITPAWVNIRLGNVPALFSAQYGLFVEMVNIGDFESAIADVRYIKPSSAAANYDHIYSIMSLSDDFELVNVESERAFKGSAGSHFPYVFESLNNVDKDELFKDLSVLSGYTPDYGEFSMLDKSAYSTASNADFAFGFTATLSDFVELAGTNVLMKIGKALGPQAELYDAGVRIHDIENRYNRTYYRELVFNVPKGYVVTNPESAEFAIYGVEDNDTICAFVSTVDYEGNTYKVTIDEYYSKIFSKKECYLSFRGVVNAAADFNKVTLILKPE